MNIFNITGINGIIAERKIVHVLLKPCFFMLSAVKSFEVLPKLNRSALFKNILLQMDRFTQHWHAKSCWMHCCVDSNKIFFVVLLIFIKYLASAVIVNHSVHLLDLHQELGYSFFPYQYPLKNYSLQSNKSNKILANSSLTEKFKCTLNPIL